MTPKTSPPPGKTFLTREQLRQRYQVSDTTIWRWIHAGVLPPPVAYGRWQRFDEAELDEADRLRVEEFRRLKRLGPRPVPWNRKTTAPAAAD